MSAGVTVRPTSDEDAQALAAIGQASFIAAYESWSEPDDLAEHLDEHFSEPAVRKALASDGCYYLLAIHDEEPAGLVKIRASDKPGEVPVSSALELAQVYVHPAKQRLGIGGRLLAAAVDFAAERSIEGLWLTVWEDAPWAVNCYLKYGFEQVGTIDFKLGKAIYNDLLMWLPVTGRKSE